VTTARRPRRSSKRDRIEVWRIILWSGLTNLVLLSVFLVAQNVKLDGLAAAYPEGLVDGELWIINPANGTSTLGRPTPKDDFSMSTMTVAKTEPGAETLDEEATTEPTADLALAAGASVDDSEVLRLKPILHKNPQNRKLEIGNFKSLSLVGSPEDCLDFGYSLLSGAGTPNDKLEVVAAADEITVARICAANGSVIITCRAGQIAVSPRRSRPDDQCAQKG
jgi:hypothetical protein